MVDRGALTVIGSFVMAVGLVIALLSGRLARSHAAYLRSGRQRPRPLRIPPFDRAENEGIIRWGGRILGLAWILIGALWLTNIGTK